MLVANSPYNFFTPTHFRCTATQVDRDGRNILYMGQRSIKLNVQKLIIPPPNTLTQKIGIISAVLLAVIFLILCCVFIMFAICKRRRRQKRSRYIIVVDSFIFLKVLYNLYLKWEKTDMSKHIHFLSF